MTKTMEVLRNKRSGKEFIVIEYNEDDSALLVNPEGDIITLSLDLFYDPTFQNENVLLREGRLNQAQLLKYDQFNKSRRRFTRGKIIRGFRRTFNP